MCRCGECSWADRADTKGCKVNPNWGQSTGGATSGGGTGASGTSTGTPTVGSTATGDRNVALVQENNKKLFVATFSADNPFCQTPGMAGQCESMRNAVSDGYDPYNAWVSLVCGDGFGNTICMNELGYRWNCGNAACPELMVRGGEMLSAAAGGAEAMGGRALLGGARSTLQQPSLLASLTRMAGKGGGAIGGVNSFGLRLFNAYCSFSGDTPVLMADGTSKPISEIKVGDEVLAIDPETGEKGPREVTRLWVHEDEIVKLEVNGHDLITTEDHPFWNQTDRQWQRADELDRGDALLAEAGVQAVVARLTAGDERATVYNLTVASIHTYYVLAGTTPVLVHNCGDLPEGYRSSPGLKGDPYHPDSVAARSRQNQELYGPSLVDRASGLGYTKRVSAQKAPFNSHGQTVFSNGKNYITRDIDGHNVTDGWKMFNRQGQRIGTYDADLNYLKE